MNTPEIGLNIAFHGLAYAMVLYLVSVGLSITLGLMGFANLAHGALAMVGGYVAGQLTASAGLSFPLALLAAGIAAGTLGAVLERLLYRRLYGRGELDQVLFTIGLLFVSIAAAKALFGPLTQPVAIPGWLKGHLTLGPVEWPAYRSFLIALGLAVAGAVWLGLDHTRFGARVRAAVEDGDTAQTLGINTPWLFTVTFTIGSALAGIGGALGAELLPVTPYYGIVNLVVFLLVVSVGGLGTIRGPFYAALLLGMLDTVCKYALPEAGSFVLFAAAFLVLMVRPNGLVSRV